MIDQELRDALRALADDWQCSDETCDGECTGCAYAADLRALLDQTTGEPQSEAGERR